jgi:hypothetical protein
MLKDVTDLRIFGRDVVVNCFHWVEVVMTSLQSSNETLIV